MNPSPEPTPVSRRSFLRGGAPGALAAGAAPLAGHEVRAGTDGLYPATVPSPTVRK